MSELFDRKVTLVVGPQGGEGVEISGFRIAFSVTKTKTKNPNDAKIDVYNLSTNTAALIESGEQGNTVQLFAGYGSSAARIFVGEIRKGKARTSARGADRVTTIEAKDGAIAYRSARISKSYDAQITTHALLRELGKEFGASIEIPRGVPDIRLSQGFVASGAARDVMDTLAESMGIEWSFEDSVLRVIRKGEDNGERAVLLTSDTGLIGSPVKTDKGVNGVSLLNPGIRPNRYIEIRTKSQQGFFLVQKVTHKGDTHGSDFFTEFEAKAVQK